MLAKSQRVALFLGYRTKEWLAAALSVKEEYEALGFQVQIYDCSWFALPRRYDHRDVGEGIEDVRFKLKIHPKASRDLVPEYISDSLEIAARKSLKSFLRNDVPRSKLVMRLLQLESVRRGKNLYQEAKSILSNGPFERVILPNGRFVHEIALTLAARELKIKTAFFELGSSRGSYVISDYSPHSRTAIQEDFLSQGLTVNPSTSNLVFDWLTKREDGVENNIFSKFWVHGDENSVNLDFENVFFTSSSDEIGALGEDWKLDSWEDQYAAFDSIMSYLNEIAPSTKSIIRIHPNLGNKSHAMFKRESKRIKWLAKRHPNLGVIWHNDPINSYNLIRNCRRVFVSLSSIGIEATILNKPVWVTSASHYDEAIKVRKIFSPNQLSKECLAEYQADLTNAILFAFFLLDRQRKAISELKQFNQSKRIRAISVVMADFSLVGFISLIIQMQLKVLLFFRDTRSTTNSFLKSTFSTKKRSAR